MKHTKDIDVLYIITKLELGGAQKVCLALLHGMQKQCNSAYLISSHEGVLIPAVENKDNVLLLKSMNREFSWKSIIQEIKCFIELVGAIKNIKKNSPHLIVHTHSTKAGLLGRWAALCAGVKTRIHTIHGYAFHHHQSIIKWLAIYLCELITSFITTQYICVSSEDVKTGVKLFPRFAKKHTIIRAAVEREQFYIPATKITTFPEITKPFIFGTIACFKPQKNLFDLLYAFKIVHHKNPLTKLEIIGDGEQRSEIEQWIIENELEDCIVLHGWQHAVAPIMSSWHSFVLSSLWEGLPCSIVEARLLKLPVLSYNTGGIHDVIIHGENGLLFKQKNWHDLASGMLELSLSYNLYAKLKSYDDNLNDFDHTTMIKEHIKLYRRI